MTSQPAYLLRTVVYQVRINTRRLIKFKYILLLIYDQAVSVQAHYHFAFTSHCFEIFGAKLFQNRNLFLAWRIVLLPDGFRVILFRTLIARFVYSVGELGYRLYTVWVNWVTVCIQCG